MFENQIIKLHGSKPDDGGISIPVNSSTRFYVPAVGRVSNVYALQKEDGTVVAGGVSIVDVFDKDGGSSDYVCVQLTAQQDGCFRLVRGKLNQFGFIPNAYTNLLHWDESDELATVSCWCDGGEVLGFPFSYDADGNEVRPTFSLPILLSAPQYKQEDKTYTKLTGEVVTLFAKYYKEWDGQTEYIPERWHDCIVAMLSCDRLYINGTLVTRSANYDVDWEKYDTADNGEKIARATFKVQENTNQRNSNY